MKFLNLTDTIVLLYDSGKILGQIEPRGTSIEIPEADAKTSYSIQNFLQKGIIRAIKDGEVIPKPVPTPKVHLESVSAKKPEDTLEGHFDNSSIVSMDVSKNKNVVYVEKQPGSVTTKVESVDKVNIKPQASSQVTSVEDMGSIIESGKGAADGKEVSIADKFEQVSVEAKKSVEELVKEIDAEKDKKESIQKELDQAPKEIKDFIAKKFMSKKWEITKSTDTVFLELVKKLDPSVTQLAEARLKELEEPKEETLKVEKVENEPKSVS